MEWYIVFNILLIILGIADIILIIIHIINNVPIKLPIVDDIDVSNCSNKKYNPNNGIKIPTDARSTVQSGFCFNKLKGEYCSNDFFPDLAGNCCDGRSIKC